MTNKKEIFRASDGYFVNQLGDRAIEIGHDKAAGKERTIQIYEWTRFCGIDRLPVPTRDKWTKAGASDKTHVFTDGYAIRRAAVPAIEEIIKKLKEEAEQAQNKLREIVPGLDELRAAIDAELQYSESFNRMMEDEQNDGVNPPSTPVVSSDELRSKYPVAAVYLKAEGFTFASHYAKCSAGKKAMAAIENGKSIDVANEILDNWLPESAKWN